jgi:acetyltransferase-like isoleucine patch superfamily enzyme
MIEPRLSSSALMLNRLDRGLVSILSLFPSFGFFRDKPQPPVTFGLWAAQRLLGINGTVYWPMHPTSRAVYGKRVRIGVETSPGWSPGCYINGINGVAIGDYTRISANVGIISGYHDPYNLSKHRPSPPIIIGKYCLLGMGCMIMPGVVLGDYTMVGANTVVTKSFSEGYVALGGSPAQVLRKLDPSETRDYISPRPYNGYVPAERFDDYCCQHLYVNDLPK